MDRGPLNVPRLRVLYELNRRGSVTAVADALWITPSAVSQHLAALQREVGIDLVERAGRGVRPTEAGRRLALAAGRVLAALDATQATARELADADSATLRIAAFPSVVLRIVAPGIERARRQLPETAFEVIDVEGMVGLDHVRHGRADIAVVDDWGYDLGAGETGLSIQPLMADPLRALLPSGHPLVSQETVSWGALAREQWVIEPGDSLYTQHVTTLCGRAGFAPRVRARVRDPATQAALVAALGAVAVLPATAIVPTPQVVARSLDPDVRRRLFLVTRNDTARTASGGVLTATLREVASEADR